MGIAIGSVFLRKDGRWEARIPVNGKQKTVACSINKRVVLQKYKDAIIHLADYQKTTNLTLFQWLDQCLDIKKTKVKSWKNDERTIRLHIKPNMKDIDITKLSPTMIDNCIAKIQTPRMQEEAYNVFNQYLKKAVKKHIIKFNECENAEKPSIEREEGRALEVAERKEFLELIKGSKYEDDLRIYLLTGCRADERLKIRGEHVNFTEETIFIDGTKTPTSRRTIPMLAEAKEILLRREIKAGQKVFTYSYEALKSYLRRLPMDVSLKDLRTTYGTILAERGVPIQLISKWMGHTSIKTTMKYYIKVLSDYEKEQAKKYQSIQIS